MFTREQIVDLRRTVDQYTREQITVALVMMATPADLQAIEQKRPTPFTLLADPEQQAYRAFEVPRLGLGAIAGPRIWLAGLRALFRGGMGKPGKDVFQMHASFLVDCEGTFQLVHYPRNSADRVTFQQILAASV